MTDSKTYISNVKGLFSFLITEFQFSIKEEMVDGNAFYRVFYTDGILGISINYENINDYLQVVIYELDNGKLPNYDDKTKTFHLGKLTAIIYPLISIKEISANDNYFLTSHINDNPFSRKLMKLAKDLRIYLHYCDRIN